MSFLLDTNILSETRKPARDPGVTAWISAAPPDRLFVSVLTIGEVEQGITRLASRGDHRQAAVLGDWLDEVLEAFRDRIVPVTGVVARCWGRQRAGQPRPAVDGLIAATAQVHDWTLVTRNIKDFESTGVRVLNPFTG